MDCIGSTKNKQIKMQCRVVPQKRIKEEKKSKLEQNNHIVVVVVVGGVEEDDGAPLDKIEEINSATTVRPDSCDWK